MCHAELTRHHTVKGFPISPHTPTASHFVFLGVGAFTSTLSKSQLFVYSHHVSH